MWQDAQTALLAVLLQLLPQRTGGADRRFVERRHIGRRRRRRRSRIFCRTYLPRITGDVRVG